LSDNAWRPDRERNQGSFDQPVYWMTCELNDEWRVTVRLVTDHYRTVIDRIHLEASDDTKLRGIRGRLELPTDDPANPTWRRYPIAGLRREASAALESALYDLHRTSTDRQAALRRGDPLPPNRREPADRIFAAIAHARGFTVPGTHPAPHAARQPSTLTLAIAAAAYADALRIDHRSARQGTQQRLDQIHRHYAPSSIGPLITKARAAGLLTPTAPGKPGGRLTAKGRQTLANANFQAPWYPPKPPKPTLKTPKTTTATVAPQSPKAPAKPSKRRTRRQSPQPPLSS
jgi:hypothetical protein